MSNDATMAHQRMLVRWEQMNTFLRHVDLSEAARAHSTTRSYWCNRTHNTDIHIGMDIENEPFGPLSDAMQAAGRDPSHTYRDLRSAKRGYQKTRKYPRKRSRDFGRCRCCEDISYKLGLQDRKLNIRVATTRQEDWDDGYEQDQELLGLDGSVWLDTWLQDEYYMPTNGEVVLGITKDGFMPDGQGQDHVDNDARPVDSEEEWDMVSDVDLDSWSIISEEEV